MGSPAPSRTGEPRPWSTAAQGAWAPLAVFAAHVLLDRGFDVYTSRPWLDVPMHLAGGLAIAYWLHGVAAVLEDGAEGTHHARLRAGLLVFTMAVTVAVGWEFAEFAVDRALGTNLQVSLPNTMQDLAMGMVGALLAVSLGLGPRRRG